MIKEMKNNYSLNHLILGIIFSDDKTSLFDSHLHNMSHHEL